MVFSTARRGRRALLAATAGALAVGLGGLVAPAVAAPLPTTTDGAQCPDPGQFPGLGSTLHAFVDSGVAVYVGGDYRTTDGAKESEGLLVVAGDASFTTGQFNLGTVGVGSGITPAAGPMLVVGEDLTLTAGAVQVGFGVDPGGDVIVGGTITGEQFLDTQGSGDATRRGTVTQGVGTAAALAPYASLGASLTRISSGLAGRTTTGTATRTGSALHLTGDGTSSPQVFEVAGADLRQASEIHYTSVGDSATPVIINVTGTRLEARINYQAIDGTRVDAGPALGNAAARILWNFTEARELTLGTNDQFVGSVLVPGADSTVTVSTSTNGRLYTGGDLVFGAGGQGLEHHNYPWIGLPELDCTPPTTPDVEDPTGDPTGDDPTGEDPTAGDPTGDDPTAGDPTGDDPTTGDPTGDDPTAGEPTGDDTTDDPTAGDPTGDDPTGDDPTGVNGGTDDELASTGSSSTVLVALAGVLLAAGVTTLVLLRRRAAA